MASNDIHLENENLKKDKEELAGLLNDCKLENENLKKENVTLNQQNEKLKSNKKVYKIKFDNDSYYDGAYYGAGFVDGIGFTDDEKTYNKLIKKGLVDA